MQGIEILTSKEVAVEWGYNWKAFWITFAIVFVICLIIGIYNTIKNSNCAEVGFMLIVGCILGAIVGTGIGDMAGIPTKYKTEYKVTISEDIQMVEFLKHYDLIDQDGKIFIIREKD